MIQSSIKDMIREKRTQKIRLDAALKKADFFEAEKNKAEAKVIELMDKVSSLEAQLANSQKTESRLHNSLTTIAFDKNQVELLRKTVSLNSAQRVEEKLSNIESENQVLCDHVLLIKSITQDLGFCGGKPVAAWVIYKWLLHWRSFEVEDNNDVFDRIIQTIASAIEVQDNNNVLAYWLSNTSTLLLLLQHTLKASGSANLTPQSAELSFFNLRMLGRLENLRQVEAKYPALLFKQQLTAFLEKIYGMIRDNLKKELSLLLGLCIQAPGTSRSSLVNYVHWQNIVKSLNNYLKMMKANYVPLFLVRKVFAQIFSFINMQLFNSLLLRRECCSFSKGEYVKSGLAELEQWCEDASEEYAGTAWDELKHIRQAVGFKVMHQKHKKILNEITNEFCPVLSIRQLYRISTMYWDDKYCTQNVSSNVISSMRVMMTEDSNNAVSSLFLLDDDLSIPFTVDDISKSIKQVEIADIDPPQLIRENSGFSFLHQRKD